MIKVEAIKDFGFSKMNEITNLKRIRKDVPEEILKGDTFECTKDMYKYLNGDNPYKEAVVRLIEYIPEKTKK